MLQPAKHSAARGLRLFEIQRDTLVMVTGAVFVGIPSLSTAVPVGTVLRRTPPSLFGAIAGASIAFGTQIVFSLKPRLPADGAPLPAALAGPVERSLQ
jgi:hypothetical protein